MSELHDLLGAYAVGALGELEHARFRAHLHGCRPCQAELAVFEETSAALDDPDL